MRCRSSFSAGHGGTLVPAKNAALCCLIRYTGMHEPEFTIPFRQNLTNRWAKSLLWRLRPANAQAVRRAPRASERAVKYPVRPVGRTARGRFLRPAPEGVCSENPRYSYGNNGRVLRQCLSRFQLCVVARVFRMPCGMFGYIGNASAPLPAALVCRQGQGGLIVFFSECGIAAVP